VPLIQADDPLGFGGHDLTPTRTLYMCNMVAEGYERVIDAD
jgi:hypothetical protein